MKSQENPEAVLWPERRSFSSAMPTHPELLWKVTSPSKATLPASCQARGTTRHWSSDLASQLRRSRLAHDLERTQEKASPGDGTFPLHCWGHLSWFSAVQTGGPTKNPPKITLSNGGKDMLY